MVTSDAVVPGGAMPAGYPLAWEFDGLLRNGEAVVVRPIQPAHAPALVGLHAIVSPGTLHRHVLLDHPTLSLAAAARFSEVDYDARMAFVAVVSDELVGLASYERPGGGTGCGGWFRRHRYLPAPRGRDLAVREPGGVRAGEGDPVLHR